MLQKRSKSCGPSDPECLLVTLLPGLIIIDRFNQLGSLLSGVAAEELQMFPRYCLYNREKKKSDSSIVRKSFVNLKRV